MRVWGLTSPSSSILLVSPGTRGITIVVMLCDSRQGHGSMAALLKVATRLSSSGVTRRGVDRHSRFSLDGLFTVRRDMSEVSHILSEKGVGAGITAVLKQSYFSARNPL